MHRTPVRSHRAAAAVAAGAMAVTVLAGFGRASAAVDPNDPLYARQWGLAVVGAAQAWETSTGKGVVIGIVDSGIDLTHADLAAHVIASTSCIGANGDPAQCHGNGQDDEGHGTHVAGIANAVTGNGVGGAGMAPDARLVVAKSVDSTGSGSLADINAGIQWVVDRGARVVNLSLGDANTLFSSFGSTLGTAVEYAWSKGAIPVLASGNSSFLGLGSSNYGNLDAVVVGAVSHAGPLAGYSSPTGNAKWAVLAPGGSADGVQGDDILSTYWAQGQANQYGYLAGTSMAAAFVSGTLALLLATGLKPADAVARLLATANPAVGCGGLSPTCRGVINASAAVAGGRTPSPPPSPLTPPSTSVVPGPPSSVPVSAAPGLPTSLPQPTSAPPPSSPTTPVAAVLPGPGRPASPGTTAPEPLRLPPAGGRAPSSVLAAPPAVMVPGHQPGPTLAPPEPVTPPVVVGLAASRHGRASGSVLWFGLLAGLFVLLVSFGIVRIMGSSHATVAPGGDVDRR